MSISRATAQAFAQAVNRLRPTWDVPGIRAAIERASVTQRQASDSELLIAAIRLAENGQVNAPALLAEDGAWWDTVAPGNTRPAWVANRVACPEHHQPLPCRGCENEAGRELTPDEIAQAAHAIRLGLPNYTPPPDRTAPLTSDMTTARERADQEQP